MNLLADDWAPVPPISRDSAALHVLAGITPVVNAFYSPKTEATVCQNPHDGTWHYCLYEDEVSTKEPCNTAPWAMMLAQERRRVRGPRGCRDGGAVQ